MTKKKDNLTYQMGELYSPRGDRRRIQILEAVIDLIAGGQATDLSLERVGKACKIRRSLVVYYFPTPELLLRSAIEYAMSFGQRYAVNRIALAATAADRLTAFIEANFEWFSEHPKHAAVFGFLNYLASCDESYRKLHSALAEMAERRLEAILLGGLLRPETTPQEVASVAALLRAHLVGILARYFTSEKQRPWKKEREATLRSFFKLCEIVWAG